MQPGSNMRAVVITAADQEIIPPDDNRIGLIIPSSNTGRFTLSFSGAAILDQGINIPTGVLPFTLTGEDWKCVVKRAIRGIAAVDPTTIQVIELIAINRTQSQGDVKNQDEIELGGFRERTLTPVTNERELFEYVTHQQLIMGIDE